MFKKVFAAMLAGLFISAPAFAEVKMSGSFFIKGNYIEDKDGVYDSRGASDDYSFYESDFELKTSFIVDENTSATLVVEAFDADWVSGAAAGNDLDPDSQNHLQVTTAKMDHNFGNGFAFTGGVDGNGDVWGTSFADNGNREYFLQGSMELPFGSVTVKTEKLDEVDVTNDDLDKDAYLVGFSLDAAGFNIKPAVYYVDDQQADTADTKLMVAISGKVAAFDLSSEIVYSDSETDDAKTYGVYVDASTTIGGLGVNVAGIYSSEDDGVGFNTSTEMAIMTIVTDDINIDGVNLIKGGVSKAVTEKITVDGAVAYLMDNVDNREIDGFEANVNASYKASDAVTLACGFATLDVDALDDNVTEAYAKINVAF